MWTCNNQEKEHSKWRNSRSEGVRQDGHSISANVIWYLEMCQYRHLTEYGTGTENSIETNKKCPFLNFCGGFTYFILQNIYRAKKFSDNIINMNLLDHFYTVRLVYISDEEMGAGREGGTLTVTRSLMGPKAWSQTQEVSLQSPCSKALAPFHHI